MVGCSGDWLNFNSVSTQQQRIMESNIVENIAVVGAFAADSAGISFSKSVLQIRSVLPLFDYRACQEELCFTSRFGAPFITI
jgi:hypothetical protein